MLLNNPTNTDRLCAHLGENLRAYIVREVPDGFEKCAECSCVVYGDQAAEAEPAE